MMTQIKHRRAWRHRHREDELDAAALEWETVALQRIAELSEEDASALLREIQALIEKYSLAAERHNGEDHGD